MGEDKELIEIFNIESNELVEQLEQGILSLEDNSEDKETINTIFRAVHSIKGSAAFIGYDNISSFAHGMENVLDLVRKDTLEITSVLINDLLKGVDVIKKLLQNPERDVTEDEEVIGAMRAINTYLPEDLKKEIAGKAVVEEKKVEVKKIDKDRYYRIKIIFNRNVVETGVEPLGLIEEIGKQGELIENNINTGELPDIYNIDPYLVYLSWTLILKTRKEQEEIEEIFIFIKEDNEVEIEEISEREINSADKKIGEILVEKGLIQDKDLEQALQKQNKVGEILVEEGKITKTQVEKIAQEQQETRKVKEASSIRVDTQKLDKLMNLVGELVINQARVAQIASKKGEINVAELNATSEVLDRITREIQEHIMKVRMIPIDNTFNQFKRLVRDLAIQKGKEVNLEIKGKETELDKTLIELISDPLKHMIRNAVDHGIESPEERRRAGKSEIATVGLNAYHEAGNIVIEVTDDGKGLNKAKILSKAKEKGLIPEGKELKEDEIYQLIFLPGFSTAEEVTEVSGRGVGMDVVRNNIMKLRGNIEINTKEGEGTTFRIILPLTLAIIDGMLVKVGKELFIIPILSIIESIRPKPSEIKQLDKERQIINVRGEYIPLIRLHGVFNIETEQKDPSKALTIIVSMGKHKACLLVDDIIGQQQAVIKSLEDNYESVPGISGATILGDGTVAMILDVGTILKLAAK